MSPVRIAVFALALVACGGSVAPPSPGAVATPVCAFDGGAERCADLPAGARINFALGGTEVSCTADDAGAASACDPGSTCYVVLTPTMRAVVGDCQPAK